MSLKLGVIYLVCIVAIIAFRVVPMMVLKGKELSHEVRDALSLIPPAAFAALVANDLIAPEMLSSGVWSGLLPFVSAVVVALVARATKSLIWSALVGLACYALLSLI